MFIHYQASQNVVNLQFTFTVDDDFVAVLVDEVVACVILFDDFTGEEFDLLESPTYRFKASADDPENRFKLIFDLNNNNNYTGLDENYTGDNFVYQNGDELIITGEGELKVYDVLGRFVMSQNVSGVERINKPAQTGVYIFMMNGNAQKIVVK